MGGSGVRLSYAELERQSNQIAQLFRSRGLRPGDKLPRLPSGKMLRRLLMDRYRSLPPS
jgi:acyl-CoA synthetase (AMP-forming)/AMP-acid ligase II